MGFRLRAKAETDILSIMNYIGQDNPAAALKWQAEIFRIFELLGDRPGIGMHHDEVRMGLKTFPRGNYLIVFKTVRNEAHILRVVHSARDWPKLVR